MSNKTSAIKTTILGGVVFLVPIIVFFVIVEKAFHICHKMIEPIIDHLPDYVVAGVAFHTIVAILVIIIFCFLAGLFGQTAKGKKLISKLENAVLGKLPGYSFMKEMGESTLGLNKDSQLQVVIARYDDYEQIGFLMDELENEKVMIYLPGSPSPWSGSTCIFDKDRVTLIDISQKDVLHVLAKMGKGYSQHLKKGNK